MALEFGVQVAAPFSSDSTDNSISSYIQWCARNGLALATDVGDARRVELFSRLSRTPQPIITPPIHHVEVMTAEDVSVPSMPSYGVTYDLIAAFPAVPPPPPPSLPIMTIVDTSERYPPPPQSYSQRQAPQPAHSHKRGREPRPQQQQHTQQRAHKDRRADQLPLVRPKVDAWAAASLAPWTSTSATADADTTTAGERTGTTDPTAAPLTTADTFIGPALMPGVAAAPALPDSSAVEK